MRGRLLPEKHWTKAGCLVNPRSGATFQRTQEPNVDEKTFDLSVPVTRWYRILMQMFGVLQMINGYFAIDRGDTFFGYTIAGFGAAITLSTSIVQRANRYWIRIGGEGIEITRGWRTRRIEWDEVTGFTTRLMAVEMELKRGGQAEISFGELFYKDNQVVKPAILDRLKAVAEEKQIPWEEAGAPQVAEA